MGLSVNLRAQGAMLDLEKRLRYIATAGQQRVDSETSAFFKTEGTQINIGLGRGTALDMFNSNMQGLNVIRF